MSMITCKYCDRSVDTDYNAEHENECRIEKVWDELIVKLIEMKNDELITQEEFKIMKEDMELLVIGTME